MNAIDLVVFHNFATEFGEIVCGGGQCGIHVPFLPGAAAEFRAHFGKSAVAETFHRTVLSDGERHDPGVEFHAAFVAFVEGEAQGVVGRSSSRCAGKDAVVGFEGGRIGCGGSESGLEKYDVDTDGLQLVQHSAQFSLLSFRGGGVGGGTGGPVQAGDGGEPNGTNFTGHGSRLGCRSKRGGAKEKEQEKKSTHLSD